MLLLTISLVTQISTSDPCAQLADVYVDVESSSYAGEDVSAAALKLLELADECTESEGGHSTALESYLLAFEQLKTADEGEGVPPATCSSLVRALLLADELTAAHPNNGRLQEIGRHLNRLEANTTCESVVVPESPAAVQREPVVDPPRSQSGLGDEHVSRPAPTLKYAAITTGVFGGVALLAGAVTTGLAVAESQKVEDRLDEEQPNGLGASNNVCKVGGTDKSAASYCETLNRLKISSAVSWSLFGTSAVTAVVLGVLYRKRRAKQYARITPQVGFSRSQFTWGARVRF